MIAHVMEKNLKLLSSLNCYIYITKFRRFGSTSQRKVIDDGFLACLNIQITRLEKKVVTLTAIIICMASYASGQDDPNRAL